MKWFPRFAWLKKNGFTYRQVEEFSIPLIDDCVAKLCAATGTPIVISSVLLGGKLSVRGRLIRQVRVDAREIDGFDRDTLPQSAIKYFDQYVNSASQSELRYSSEFNWALIDLDNRTVQHILGQYAEHLRVLHPGCEFIVI